jgi:TusA-related sulfurtransferase
VSGSARRVLHLDRVAIDATPPDELVRRIFDHDAVVVWSPPLLDLRGEVCPFTFVRTKLRLEEMQAGDRLRVLVDHEPASRNVPRSAREWGQAVLHVGPIGGGVWEILIQKGETSR